MTGRTWMCWGTALVLFARAAALGDEPGALAPTVSDVLAQAKPDPDDKKKPADKKDKQPVPPPVVAEDTVPFEGRLEMRERTLPRAFEHLGDQPPPIIRTPIFLPVPVSAPVPVGGGGPGGAAGGGQNIVVLPGTRGFKVAENSSPRPQDRVYFGFNAFQDLHEDANRRLGANVQSIRLYRETFGLEKTFLDGDASIDLRLPLNTLTVRSGLPILNGTHTDVGDLSIILRYALYRDDELDNWFTAGLAVTVPTGPDTLAGIDNGGVPHSTVLQPFVGFLWNYGDLYVQGFSALDLPTDTSDVTFFFNDLGLGYFVYRSEDPYRVLTAFAPALEVHVTTPLDHRGPISAASPIGASDIVNLGVVANMEFYGRARLSVGLVTPVTGPNPFDIEALVQLRISY